MCVFNTWIRTACMHIYSWHLQICTWEIIKRGWVPLTSQAEFSSAATSCSHRQGFHLRDLAAGADLWLYVVLLPLSPPLWTGSCCTRMQAWHSLHPLQTVCGLEFWVLYTSRQDFTALVSLCSLEPCCPPRNNPLPFCSSSPAGGRGEWLPFTLPTAGSAQALNGPCLEGWGQAWCCLRVGRTWTQASFTQTHSRPLPLWLISCAELHRWGALSLSITF